MLRTRNELKLKYLGPN